MKFSLISKNIRRLGLISVFLATATLPWSASFAAEKKKPPSAAAAVKAEPMLSPEEFRKQEDWRASMQALPAPKKGCFTARFPSKEWQEVPCVPGPAHPMPPRGGVVPEVVGNGNDIAAKAPSGFIASATGSMKLSNVTSESGQIGATGPAIANAYTLQVNTDTFKTDVCSSDPDCRGWQQFIFENNNVSHQAYIQYWLIKYNKTCPSGWTNFPAPPDIYCVILANSSGAVNTPPVPVTNLGQVTLTGTASAAGDSIVMTIGPAAYTRAGDNAVHAAKGWTIAEFNVLGDGGSAVGVGSQAAFNPGASIETRTRVTYDNGGTAAPICVAQGFTAETNNLSFGPTAPAASPPGPALIFTQSIAGGSPSSCAAATSIADTHLTTLSGLLYDFQAAGDFELLQTGSGFTVQNRQVSGAPNWPDATINAAVATRIGKTEAVVCLKPPALFVDRKPVALRQGKALVLADGTQITLSGSAYLIRGSTGDWVRATVNPSYIDVKVGLGQWPIDAQGLLVNVKGDPNLLAARDGKVLKNPFSFEELYHPYADSWRVKPSDSMLNVCGEGVKAGIPNKPFLPKDLAPALAQRNYVICTSAGVKKGPLFDACMIDVAMLGAGAALIHAKTPTPAAVGEIK